MGRYKDQVALIIMRLKGMPPLNPTVTSELGQVHPSVMLNSTNGRRKEQNSRVT
jgi:hypothetical protein